MSKPQHRESVPRLFKDAARIRKEVNNGKGLESLVFSSKHRNVKGLYALVCKSLKNDSLLDNVFEETGILNEKFDPDLAKILVTELLWGKQKLPGGSIPITIVLEHQSKLEEAVEKSSIPVTTDTSQVAKPRYARINTWRVTVKGTIQRLVDDGWELIDTPDDYGHFIDCVTNLSDTQFMQDYHFDELLAFRPKTELHESNYVQNGSLILQDKASCLPAQLLNPKPDSIVLDMCAAPGIKTAQLASLMQNKGTLYAVDNDQKRFETMKTKIEQLSPHHNCVKMFWKDSVHLTSEECPGVQYILVDPSCSGTGMTKRIEDGNNVSNRVSSARIQKLSNFQERLLVQALTAFPDVERVVYSTCSTLQNENEQVLEKVLARVPSFQVVAPELKKTWKHRGGSEYPFGSNCLVANTEKDQTNGFFVAVLERIPGMAPSTKGKELKRKSNVASNETNGGWQVTKTRKRAKKMKKQAPKEIKDVNVNSDDFDVNVGSDDNHDVSS